MCWRRSWVIWLLLLGSGLVGGERLRGGVPSAVAPYPLGFAMPSSQAASVRPPTSEVGALGGTSPLSHEPGLQGALTNNLTSDGRGIWALGGKQHLGPRLGWPATDTVPFPDGSGQVILNPGDWKFFIFDNEAGLTNLAFLTFAARASSNNLPEWQNVEPDLDIYVSMDYELTNLAPFAVANALKSISRRGSETLLLTDGMPGFYYLGVKTEAPVDSDFAVLALAREEPFSSQQADGSIIMAGFPVPGDLNDATASGPGTTYAIAVTAEPGLTDRVVVSNTISHARLADLRGWISHEGMRVGLNQYPGPSSPGTVAYAWDDSGLGWAGTEHTHGPGSLLDYSGHRLAGQWLLTLMDLQPGATGTNLAFSVQAFPSQSGPATAEVAPGTTLTRTITVSETATNLVVKGTLLAGQSAVRMQLCRAGGTSGTCAEGLITEQSPFLELDQDKFSSPPLNPGEYLLRFSNEGPEAAIMQIEVDCFLDWNTQTPSRVSSVPYQAIADNGITTAVLPVVTPGLLVSLNAGVRVQHPRLSDLEIRLEAPDGTSALLSALRGGDSTEGFGFDTTVTNTQPVGSSGGPEASTNLIEVGTGPGAVTLESYFYELPDTMRVYRGESLIFNSGMQSGSNLWTLSYGMHASGLLTVVMNEGDNYDTNTLWDYVVTTTKAGMLLTTFTEDTNLAPALIKFAPPPFTNVTATTGPGLWSNIIAYIPEQSLEIFRGKNSAGDWRLHIRDTQAGPASPPVDPLLIAWDLHFILQDPIPLPIPLSHASARTNVVRERQWALYSVDVPAWAERATNQLVFSSGPVSVWFGADSPPLGTNAADVRLLQGVAAGSIVLTPNGTPPLQPGARYYLAIQNTNDFAVNTALRVSFDVHNLPAGQATPVQLSASNSARYFAFEPSVGIAAITLLLTNVTGNPELVLRRGMPLPALDSYDYSSLHPALESEEIIVSRDSTPVALGPGLWHVGVVNGSPDTAASGSLLLLESTGAARISRILTTEHFVRLEWNGPPRSRYTVESTPTLDTPTWTPFPGVVTSDTDRFIFQDTAPTAPAKYYRVTRSW